MIPDRLEARIEPFVRFDHVGAGPEGPGQLSDVSFEVGRGERVALIGPGASGKTLIVRLILGLARPTSGTISVFGERPGSVAALRRLGAVLESSDFPSYLKVREIISLVREHFPDPAPVHELVERFRFEESLDKAAGSLNVGTQRWLSVLLSMLGRPEGLVIDGPTVGMEIEWRYQFWDHLREFTRGSGSALVATDVLHDLETQATRILLLHGGRIIADGSSSEIRKRYGKPPDIVSPLDNAGVRGPGTMLTAQQAALAQEQLAPMGLEDVVLRLTQEEDR